ncbi:MAG: HAMP domain-containing sensor histidine kinase [Pleurocapsa sp. MO_192.B19]|nr:HAMP domain-containing sensor histidine kinase [Pleurocapsa sp. MO_192.B19]
MSLITISTQFLRHSFPIPSKRLISIYLTVAVAIVSASEISLYFLIIRNLDRQSNHELLNLVEIATPSLDVVKAEGLENLEREISWQNLFAEQEQSLEWFDARGKLLGREGTNFLNSPLNQSMITAKSKENFPLFERWDQVRAVTIAVYTSNLDGKTEVLKGYIRASESTEETDVIRDKLRLGLALGGGLALILISIGSVYLTQQTIMPVEHGLKKLKRMTTDASHQLRTPLTRISMATEILLTHTDKIQPSDTRKLNIINDAVEQLKRLIEDLLFLIRIDLTANMEELQFSDTSLNLLLQNLKRQFEPIANSKNIDFQIQISNGISIKGNAVELNRLLANLLENAIDYTESGGKVHLTASLASDTAIISVQDTGMGINAQDLPFIFQHFWRGDLARSKRPEGSGLGLTIARAVVQQHQGIIKVRSEPEQGSRFELHFPLGMRIK